MSRPKYTILQEHARQCPERREQGGERAPVRRRPRRDQDGETGHAERHEAARVDGVREVRRRPEVARRGLRKFARSYAPWAAMPAPEATPRTSARSPNPGSARRRRSPMPIHATMATTPPPYR